MILRFRDFGNASIPEHIAIIDRCGYVWWGWWGVPNEKVPCEALDQYQNILNRDGKMEIVAWNSGNNTLFGLSIHGIFVSGGDSKCCSPETEKTPAYYRETEWKVWFKIGDIRELPEEELSRWSYAEEYSTVEDPDSEAYLDKQIIGFNEILERRHRTIYFVKPYQPDKHRTGLLTPFILSSQKRIEKKYRELSSGRLLPAQTWNRLTEASKRSLATAEYLYESHSASQGFDHSATVTCYAAVVETELQEHFTKRLRQLFAEKKSNLNPHALFSYGGRKKPEDKRRLEWGFTLGGAAQLIRHSSEPENRLLRLYRDSISDRETRTWFMKLFPDVLGRVKNIRNKGSSHPGQVSSTDLTKLRAIVIGPENMLLERITALGSGPDH